ncbi:MAG: transposase [Tissierellaceae bacterium]
MPQILIYEENKPYVIDQFHNGRFDYIDVVQEVVQRDFFRYISSTLLLNRLAESYPWPRSKEEVPRWFYIAADMAMRLHGNPAFQGFPWVVRTGGLLSAFGPKIGTKHVDPDGKVRIECPGFNAKNAYPRQTPCDPDFLRKIAKDTPPESLAAWFNGPVQKIFRRHRHFDKGGLLIGDGSYVFVPDNENYKGSVKMLFDENDHPVGKEQAKKMSDAQLKLCQWRRCYKIVSLLHTNENGDFFLYAGMRIVPGNDHECPILWEMVDEFVAVMGKGVIKELLLDRGFLDGAAIGKVKTQYDIDVTIGVKRNMNVFEDALALANLPETQWECYTREGTEPPVPFKRNDRDAPRPEHIKQREATRQQTLNKQRAANERPPVKEPEQLKLARIKGLTSWSSCPVPLDMVVCRDSKDESLDNAWGILTTKQDELKAVPVAKRYHFRIHIEERHRHLKCFWDLAGFSSPCFSLVVNQIIFTVLTYSLLQQQIFRKNRKALNKASKSRLLEELTPVSEAVIVYVDHYYAVFDKLEYTGMVLDVPEAARGKLRKLLKRKRTETRVVKATRAPP